MEENSKIKIIAKSLKMKKI